jgi:hypothetical protein
MTVRMTFEAILNGVLNEAPKLKPEYLSMFTVRISFRRLLMYHKALVALRLTDLIEYIICM